MDIDLGAELDRSLGTGPPHRPIEERLRQGRRALRRRRASQLGGTLAAVLVLSGLGAAAAGWLDPTPTATEHWAATGGELPVDDTWRQQCEQGGDCEAYLANTHPVDFSGDGRLVRLTDEVVVNRVVVDPAGLSDVRSAAVEAHFRGRTHWLLLTWVDGRGAGIGTYADEAGLSFDEWVRTAAEDPHLLLEGDPD